MKVIEAIILGIIQGLTEFLPVSSSGHLVLGQHLLGVQSPGITLEVVLHLGTLLSVVIVYWQDIIGLFRGFFSLVANPGGGRSMPGDLVVHRKMVILILIGMIPTGIMGFFLEPIFERLFATLIAVGIALILTGIVLFSISRLKDGRRRWRQMNFVDALIIGLAQGCAIVPGLSRSGMTISSALGRGMDRETATRYSFLLSLPAIAGAAVLKFDDIMAVGYQGDAIPLIAGFLAAMIAGIIAIRMLIAVLQRGRMQYFAYYVWAVAAVTLWMAL